MSPRSRMADPARPPERRDVRERLADELRQDIRSGRYRPGDRLPARSRVLVRREVRGLLVPDRLTDSAPGRSAIALADSLAADYYHYELVRDTELAAPGPVSAMAVLAGLGRRPGGYHDRLCPRPATPAERRLLGLPQISVVLEQARTVAGTDGQPLLLAHRVRRGDGATFSL